MEETNLSTVSFTCHFVVYDAKYFRNPLYFEDVFLGSHHLANTITHQNVFSKGGHKSKGTKQWACKANQTGEQETLMSNSNNKTTPPY